tara:strand:+ start:1096 stop:1365 length:270 start_codon:yes stop_codon:yes gene_type:complete
MKKEEKDLTPSERFDLLDRAKSREIVQSILDFGVSQKQIVYILKLLSLELEDVQAMQKINEFIDNSELLDSEDVKKVVDGKTQKTKIYT